MPEDNPSSSSPLVDDPDSGWGEVVDTALANIRKHLEDTEVEARRSLESAFNAVSERASEVSAEHDDIAERSRLVDEATAALDERTREVEERERLAAEKSTRAAVAITTAAKQLADAKLDALELMVDAERRVAAREAESDIKVAAMLREAEDQAAEIVAGAHAIAARARGEMRRLVDMVQQYLADPEGAPEPLLEQPDLDLRPIASETGESAPAGETPQWIADAVRTAAEDWSTAGATLPEGSQRAG